MERKELKKETWREFLEGCNFEEWGWIGYRAPDDESTEDKYIIEEYDITTLLNQFDVEYDEDKHIIDWGEPVEIIDWDEDIKFYIVYIWNENTMEYKAYYDCFFTKEDAEKFVDELKKGES